MKIISSSSVVDQDKFPVLHAFFVIWFCVAFAVTAVVFGHKPKFYSKNLK
jgi:hypothetical protein